MSELVTVAGANSGQTVTVQDNSALVQPKTEFLQAVEDGLAFSWSNLSTDIDANDTMLLVENNSTDYDLVIQTIIVATDASGQLAIFTASGDTPTGTALVGVNLNRNSNFIAPATAKADDTGNGEQALGYPTRYALVYGLANQAVQIDVNGGLILPYDYNIGVDATAEPTGCNATIIGYFRAR